MFLKLEIIKKIIGVVVLAASIPFGLLFMCYVSIVTSIICLVIIIFNLFNTRIFGYNYLDYDLHELLDSIILINTKIWKRNSKITKNVIRGKYK